MRAVYKYLVAFVIPALSLFACGGDDSKGGGGAGGDGADGSTSSSGGGEGGSQQQNQQQQNGSDGGGNTGGGDAAPSQACGAAGAPTGYIPVSTMMVAGLARTYALYVPASYDNNKPYPVVFALHGDGGTGSQMHSGFKLEPAANDAAIFVYPDGLNKTWDTDSWVDPNKDVPFIDALITQIQNTYCTDKNRLFVTGMSRGAYMSNQLGCWRGGVIRAIAPHSGGGPYDATGKHFDKNGVVACPGKPIPALMIHGDADTTVNLSEGMKSLTYWTYADKCQMTSTATMPSPCTNQDSCTTSPVTFCKIPGLTHTEWANAPDAIWGFFDSMK